MTFDDLAQALRNFKSKAFGKGATVREIAMAEKQLGNSINGGYREFLLAFGWGGVEHLDLYGLGSDVPRRLDLIRVTESERTEMMPKLPVHLVPIMNDGAGNLYCLDTRFGEPPIVFWDHEASEGQHPAVEATCFNEWLLSVINSLE